MSDYIPDGWALVSFGDVVEKVVDKVDPDTSGLSKYVSGGHMSSNDFKIRSWGVIGDGYLGPSFHMRFKPGQVLYGSRRTYLRKVGLPHFEGICANTTFVLESKDPNLMLQEYLPLLMLLESFHKYSELNSKGSVTPYINFSDLKKYELVLPPVDVQNRIVKVIEPINDHLNALEVLYETTKPVERSLSSRLMSLKEEEYRQSSFRDEVEIVVGTAFKSKIYRKCEVGIPLVRGKNIGPDGFRWDEVFHWPDNLLEGYENNLLDTGEILIPMDATFTSAGMIKAAIVREDDLPLLLNQRVASLSAGRNLTNDYLWTLIHSQAFADHLKSSQTGSFAPHISKGQIEKFVFQVPKISRQKEIYSEINSVNSLRTNLKFQIEKVLELRKTLISDLLCGSLQISDDFEVPA